MTRIVCVHGKSNSGKSSALNYLIKNCQAVEERGYFEPLTSNDYDRYGLYFYEEDAVKHYLIIGTAGDWAEHLDKVFEFYSKVKALYEIEAVIVPSRMRGYSYNRIWEIANAFGLDVISYNKNSVGCWDGFDKAGFSEDYCKYLFDYMNLSSAENILNIALARYDVRFNS